MSQTNPYYFKMKDKKTKKSKRYDPRLALTLGDSFKKLSLIFVDKLSDDISIANEQALKDLGGMISSATLLSMSIESYFKSLINISGKSVPDSHDLYQLYTLLPEELRTSIENCYDRQNEQNKGKKVTAKLVLALSVEDVTDEEFENWDKTKKRKTLGYSLKSILKRNSNVYFVWRYMYEKKNDDRIEEFSYEFARLRFIAECLRENIVNIIKNRAKKK